MKHLLLFLNLCCLVPIHRATKVKTASSLFRKDAILDVSPIAVYQNVNIVGCTVHCANERYCKSFNYGDNNCLLLSEMLCDGKNKRLTPKVGYRYFDIIDAEQIEKEVQEWATRNCQKEIECLKSCEESNVEETNAESTNDEILNQTVVPGLSLAKYKYLVIKEEKSFSKAKKICKKRDGEMASPKSLDENLRIILKIKDNGRPFSSCYWIGIKSKSSNTFVFASGGKVKDLFFPDGYPLIKSGCVSIRSSNFKWNVDKCKLLCAVVCQLPLL